MPYKFHRMGLLVGPEGLNSLAEARVAIFGVGGVGSWTAETLIRSGVGHLDIIDADKVAESNINRQLIATTSTIGRSKVEVLRERLLDINPEADIRDFKMRYDSSTSALFPLERYTHVVDAIDSLADKADLILAATSTPGLFFCSSMGAASRLDPERIKVAEFWKVEGCPLAAALRRRFRKTATFPRRRFKCVYSDEAAIAPSVSLPEDLSGPMTFNKVAINGAACHITAIFGLRLAALIVNDILRSAKKSEKNLEG